MRDELVRPTLKKEKRKKKRKKRKMRKKKGRFRALLFEQEITAIPCTYRYV